MRTTNRIIKKRIKYGYLDLRAILKHSIFHSGNELENLYIATVQKTGSQWVKAIFNDAEIQKYTGLKDYPQRRYEWTEFQTRFPHYTFVPGLYISYGQYEEIVKPEKYKTLYVIRDPRNIIVSWYYSMLSSHALMGKVNKHRQNLQSLTKDEGITYCIKEFYLKLAFMRTWMLNQDDPNLLIVRFENLTTKPLESFQEIFQFLNIDIPQKELNEVLNRYTKDKMRQKDITKRKEGELSHYRAKKSNHKEIFAPHHYELFYSLTGDLIESLGYEE